MERKDNSQHEEKQKTEDSNRTQEWERRKMPPTQSDPKKEAKKEGK
jgi:hypothetical protein